MIKYEKNRKRIKILKNVHLILPHYTTAYTRLYQAFNIEESLYPSRLAVWRGIGFGKFADRPERAGGEGAGLHVLLHADRAVLWLATVAAAANMSEEDMQNPIAVEECYWNMCIWLFYQWMERKLPHPEAGERVVDRWSCVCMCVLETVN